MDDSTDWNSTFFYATMSVKLTYQGEGWLSFAVSPDGGMIGSDAIIGTPDDMNVSKYHLTFDDAPGYLALPEANQTLMDANITQEDGVTVLEFTRFLEEEGELPINGTGLNHFLVAYGTSNELAYHGPGRVSFNATLEPCIPPFDEEEVREFLEGLVEEYLEGLNQAEEIGDMSTGGGTVVLDEPETTAIEPTETVTKDVEKPTELESGATRGFAALALSMAAGVFVLVV